MGRVTGKGEMAERIRGFDWAGTALGSLEHWSQTLLATVNIILASPLPMQVLWGPELIVLYNDALIPIMSSKHLHALGTPARECWSEVWPIVGSQLEGVLAKGEALSFSNVILPIVRDGSIQDVYFDYSYIPVHGPDGRVDGIFNTAHDTTEAVRAQQQLRDSEARAVRILRSIGDAVIVTDAETQVRRMNPVAEQLTGWSQEEALGIPLNDIFKIVNETTRQPVESPADKAKRLGRVVGLANHTILIARDGRETHIDDSGAPIRNDEGVLIGTVLVFRNINERRRVERERNALTSQLDQVMRATTDAIVIVDRDWTISYLNPRAAAIYSAGGPILGEKLWDRFPGASYEGSPYMEHYHRAMNEGIAGRFEAYYPDPLNIWLKIEVYPTETGIVTFSRDVTLQKQTDAALIQTEKLAAVGRLAASIAHEINNPLEAVTNLLYLAQSSEQMPEVQEYLSMAERELRRVSIISNQTLRFYKQSSAPRSVFFAELVGTVLAVHQGRIVNSSIHIEERSRTAKPIVCFDGEIRQVLNNLIGNSIDALPPKGGRLLLRSREATHWPTSRKGLMITIADTGSGISREALGRIFEAFFTTKGIQGNGLGLWVSREIVENHRGALRVRSSQMPGRSGTVFTLFLPFATAIR